MLCGGGRRSLRALGIPFTSKSRVSKFLVDDTLVWVGDGKAWMIVAYDPFRRRCSVIWLTPEKK